MSINLGLHPVNFFHLFQLLDHSRSYSIPTKAMISQIHLLCIMQTGKCDFALVCRLGID